MAVFKARQVARIRDAVALGRAAVRRTGGWEPLIFARAYVEAGGPQVPGDPSTAASESLGQRLLAWLADSEVPPADDADLAREVSRCVSETRWALSLDDDGIVGFLLDLPEEALENPTVEALAHQSQGLGPGVFRKADILVLQPECDGARFIPVTDHDIEC